MGVNFGEVLVVRGEYYLLPHGARDHEKRKEEAAVPEVVEVHDVRPRNGEESLEETRRIEDRRGRFVAEEALRPLPRFHAQDFDPLRDLFPRELPPQSERSPPGSEDGYLYSLSHKGLGAFHDHHSLAADEVLGGEIRCDVKDFHCDTG